MVEVPLKKLKPTIQILYWPEKLAFHISAINVPKDIVDLFNYAFIYGSHYRDKAGNDTHIYRITTNSPKVTELFLDIKKLAESKGIKYIYKRVSSLKPFAGYQHVPLVKIVSRYLKKKASTTARYKPPRSPPGSPKPKVIGGMYVVYIAKYELPGIKDDIAKNNAGTVKTVLPLVLKIETSKPPVVSEIAKRHGFRVLKVIKRT